MKSIIRAAALGIATIVVLASVLVHPSGAVKSVKSDKPLLAGTDIDPVVFGTLQRSCQNCHSEKTEWPWYSYVAPMSWLVEGDVSQARRHMNLSHWDEYTIEQKQELLARVGAVIRSKQMPPQRYTLLHPNAKLSPAERGQMYEWAHDQRRRLKSVIPTSLGKGF